ncbi:Ger(x)C family spore germination protein [Bacillus sp. CLL-7-23]|uniref:Ger(X)C family spore germination protein n=1 Tax=Bacillus changyiensis TaxID=3004103 RepID=A0ABT4X309_9BACI|nr:Ger(x)C family spore germination protein [Bacillus changyiensis]MDA7026472.1 Ger(x)C family spore germination protein [Bacillus changyiensis]
MRRKYLLVLFMLTSMLLQGCWDKKEMTDLALISAVGIDKDKNKRYEITFQIINPSSVAGGLQGGQGGERPPVTSFSVAGDNFTSVSRQASTEVSRRLYYAHANVVIIGEEVAKDEGIVKILDVIDRDTEFRSTSTLVIAKGTKAKDIVRTVTTIEKIPANKINKVLQFTEEQEGEHIKVGVQDVLQSLASKSKSPLVPLIKLTGDKEKGESMENVQTTSPSAVVKAGGMAVIKDGKFVDRLTGKIARGVLWIRGRVKKTHVNIKWNHQEDAVTYDLTRQKTKVTPQLKNGKLKMVVHVDTEGDVGEVNTSIRLEDPKVLHQIEQKIEKKLKKQLEETVRFAQENKIDVLQFGDIVYRSQPNMWKKIEKQWNDKHFPQLDVDISINSFVHRTGLKANPKM